jgi:hypothetical protein
MGLVDLTTNLRSLRYGKDTVGGGNSNQPYVQTKIPDSFSKIGKTGGPDFLLRGGTLLPKIVVNDVSRLAQMFFDFKSPTGPLFIAKQNILSLTNVNSETGYQPYTQEEVTTSTLSAIGQFIKDNVPLNQGAYTPLSTLAQAVGNPIGIHVNKQGLNPFKFKTTQGSPNGNGPLGLPTYLNTIATSGNNGPKSRLAPLYNSKINVITQDQNLYSYSGGPGAILGVGKTNIVMLGDQRTGINNERKSYWDNLKTPQFVSNKNIFKGKDGFNNPPPSLSFIAPQLPYSYIDPILASGFFREDYLDTRNASVYESGTVLITDTEKLRSGTGTGIGPQVFTQQQIEEYGVNIDPLLAYEPTSKDSLVNKPSFTSTIAPSGSAEIPASLDYTRKNIEQRVNLGDPGRRGNRSSYSIGFRDGTNTLATENNIESIKANSGYNYALDKINALPLYQSDSVTLNNIKNDLVKFRIGVLNNKNPNLKTYIHFRAHIDSMSDNFSADWQSQKYMGRGENFYKYQGFDRSLSLSWTVAAQSKQELIPMYQKLNYLASITAPSYSSEGYMGGNLISLTIGGYLHEQIGIIKGLTLDAPTESPWEISIPDNNTIQVVPGSEDNPDREIFTDPSVKELPMIIKVTGFNFIPIHNFVPKVQDNDFAGGKTLEGGGTFVGSYGPEHYINLLAASGNNYDGQGNNLNYIPPRPKEVFANTLANISRLKLF